MDPDRDVYKDSDSADECAAAVKRWRSAKKPSRLSREIDCLIDAFDLDVEVRRNRSRFCDECLLLEAVQAANDIMTTRHDWMPHLFGTRLRVPRCVY